MSTQTCDAIVIGGGPGGYVCSIRLAQLGQDVVCIERESLGGVCLNWGCIPSKALISVSHNYQKLRHAGPMGLRASDVHVDVEAMQDWKDGIVRRLTGGIGQLFKANGVRHITGSARVVDARTVEVSATDGSTQRVEARKAIVVATGANTIDIPSLPMDGKTVVGAREAVSLRKLPRRLGIIGGGVIGLELGTVYHQLGCEVFIIEALPQLLTGVEPECTQVVERKLRKAGVRIVKEAKATGYDRQPDGSNLLRVETANEGAALPTPTGEAQTFECDVLLVAVGMRPNSQGFGLEEAGVRVTDGGAIKTDAQGRTNVPGVYAIGDVTGPPLLAHKASKEGEIVAEVIAGHRAAKDWAALPYAIFSDPEIASVGLTTQQAREAGREVKTGKFPFGALGRAMVMGETDGFVKVVMDARSHELLGVHIVGPSASDLIAEGTLGLELGAFAEDLNLTVHTHPTLAEAIMEAGAHALGQAIHTMNR